MPDSSPSALVIRLDAIGDALALTPLLAALRARSIPVDLVMRSGNADIFSSSAARNIHIARFALRSSTRANIEAIEDFGKEHLRPFNYSHVLVATEDPGGYRLARAVGAPHRIGFVNGWGKPLKTLWAGSMLTQRVVRSAGLDPRAPHECQVLYRLGLPLVGDTEISRDASVLRPLIVERDPGRGAEVVFQVTDKWERLGIAVSSVVAALTAVSRAYTLRAISAERESAYADQISAASGISVERYAELEPWKEAIARARTLVAPDSGAIHVAGMTGTPTIAIFPPMMGFALQSARWAPWAAPSRIIAASGDWAQQLPAAIAAL